MRLRTIVPGLVWACGLLQAQIADIAGIIYDPSGHPAANAEVTCGGATGRTGPDGAFVLRSTGPCAAEVRLAGFQTQTVALSGTQNRLVLAMAGVSDRVVVTATRRETSLEEAGVAGTIVTSEDLEQRQTPFLGDVLRELPGMQVARTGRYGGVTTVFTRGSRGAGTLVLLDGIPLNEPGGDLDLSYLSTDSVDRVEVVRGPQSALFGAEAAAGVVQLFSRRGGEGLKPHGALSYERGSFQTDRWRAHLNGGADRFDYALGAEQFHTVSAFVNDYYRNTNGIASAGVRLTPRTQLRGLVRAFDTALGTPDQTAYGVYNFDAHQTGRDVTALVRLDDVRGSRFVQRLIAGHHRAESVYTDLTGEGPYAIAALLRTENGSVPRIYRERLADPRTAPAPGSLPAGWQYVGLSISTYPSPSPYVNRTDRTDLDYQGTVTQTRGATVFGYEYERQGGFISERDVTRHNHGLFIHQQYTVAGRVFLTGGARVEQNNVFGTKFTPRAAVSLRLAGEHGLLSSTYLRASAGRGITEPTLLQSFAREAYYVGNPNLRLEKTNSYEAGVVQEWFSRRVRTEAAIFQNSFRDLIVFSFAGPLGTWENIDASRARGLELSGEAKATRLLTLRASYTLLATRILQSSSPQSTVNGVGQELVRRPRHAGSVSLAIAPRRWFVQASANFVGERQDIGLFGENRNPGYWYVAAGGGFRVNRHLSPFVRVENAANARYEEVLGYSSLSRQVRGGVRYEW